MSIHMEGFGSHSGGSFQMNLHTMGTELSPATLNVFDSVAIMLCVRDRSAAKQLCHESD